MSANRPLRVLIVEDETLVSMLVEDILSDLGWEVPANVASIADALQALETGDFDVALLDVNVAGEEVFPIADALIVRNIPFVFTTGYGAPGVRADLRHHPVLQKPFTSNQLIQMMLAAAGR